MSEDRLFEPTGGGDGAGEYVPSEAVREFMRQETGGPAPPKGKPGRKTKAELDAREAELAAREVALAARETARAAPAGPWQPPGADPRAAELYREVKEPFTGIQCNVRYGIDSTDSVRPVERDLYRGGEKFSEEINGSPLAKRCVTVTGGVFWTGYSVRSVARGEFRMPSLEFKSGTLLGPLMSGLAAETLAFEERVAEDGGFIVPGFTAVVGDFQFHDFERVRPQIRAWREWMEEHDQVVVAVTCGHADHEAAGEIADGLVIQLVGEGRVVNLFGSLAQSIADSLRSKARLKDLLTALIKAG